MGRRATKLKEFKEFKEVKTRNANPLITAGRNLGRAAADRTKWTEKVAYYQEKLDAAQAELDNADNLYAESRKEMDNAEKA